ncbi:MAG: alpha/beta hydrolase [Planctomycetota bacterium]|jgi:acetyl esterase/lipase
MAEISGFTDLAYGEHDRQKIDVFRPAGHRAAPLVLLIHGGGWSGGCKEQYRRTCLPLAEAGIASASIGYRLLPDAAWPEIAWDVLRGAEYLVGRADELGIDTSRAVTWGSSAGGHLALMLQAWRDRWFGEGVVAAAPEVIGTVAQCPVVDFPKPAPEKINRRALMNGRPHEEVSPAHVGPELFRSVLVAQGDADETTPLPAARAFVEQLAAAGVDARLEVISGAKHGYGYDTLSEHSQACLAVAIPYVKELFSR